MLQALQVNIVISYKKLRDKLQYLQIIGMIGGGGGVSGMYP